LLPLLHLKIVLVVDLDLHEGRDLHLGLVLVLQNRLLIQVLRRNMLLLRVGRRLDRTGEMDGPMEPRRWGGRRGSHPRSMGLPQGLRSRAVKQARRRGTCQVPRKGCQLHSRPFQRQRRHPSTSRKHLHTFGQTTTHPTHARMRLNVRDCCTPVLLGLHGSRSRRRGGCGRLVSRASPHSRAKSRVGWWAPGRASLNSGVGAALRSTHPLVLHVTRLQGWSVRDLLPGRSLTCLQGRSLT
jgi:hypothetical protein